MLQGHRGDPEHFPENSMDGFLHCAEHKISAIEMDIVVSKDLRLIVAHDPFINEDLFTTELGNKWMFGIDSKTLMGLGFKTKMTYPVLRHPKLSSLEEVIGTVIDYCNSNSLKIPIFTIELKSEPSLYGKAYPQPSAYAQIVVNFLKKHPKLRYRLQSFDVQLLREIKDLCDAELILLVAQKTNPRQVKALSKELKLQGIGLHHALITDKNIGFLKELDIEISAWTVNTEDELKRLLNLGIYNIITDKSIEFKGFLKKQGYSFY